MPPTIFSFFGLREDPFKINPDPRFLVITEKAQATSAELTYAIRSRKGLILLTGEVGTGKTMMIRRLLDWLADQKIPTALIFNSHIKPEHLLDLILNDFGITCPSNLRSDKLLTLHHWLLERYRAGQTPVLVVDEAQGLDLAALEEIRLLLNIETPREKLLQIILAGQPELEIHLKRHELRQLRQRITIRCRTAPLTAEETHDYISERLRIAGSDGRPIFDPDAVSSVHAYSHGIPRVINVLCEHALINACADGASTISPATVEQAAHECQLDRADSIARILNTGSYSTATLSEIGSILNAISTGSEADRASTPTRASSSAQESPVTPPFTAPESRPVVAASYASARTNSLVPAAPLEAHVSKQESSPAVIAQDQESFPLSTPSFAAQETEPDPVFTPSAPRFRLESLQLWYRSFVRDLRSSSRQFRRALRSFETQHWDPFVRHMQRNLRQVSLKSLRFLSDPRWKQLRAKFAFKSQAAWRNGVSLLPPRLGRFFGAHQHRIGKRVLPGHSRAPRPRAILSLRRWLHEPLTTQHRSNRAQHRH